MANRTWNEAWIDVHYIDDVTDEESYTAGPEFVVVWDEVEDIAYTVNHRYDVLNYISNTDG